MKLPASAVLSFLTVASLAAAPAPVFQLSVSVDRSEAVFATGEPVICTIALTKDGEPVNGAEVTWTFSKDGLPPCTNGSAKLVEGKATATGRLAEPGFLQCRASFRETPQAAALTALGGAAIAPLEIKPSLPVPDDFEAFWKRQKERLAAVPLKPALTPDSASTPTLEVFDVRVECVGAPVSGYFARPKGAAPKSLPAILTVHGAGVGSSNRAGVVRWGGEGALAMDINAHGLPNGKPAEFYKALADGELKDYRIRGAGDRETVYFLGMFLRLVRAIDFLAAQPEWNGRDLIVYGSSQGGFQAFAAAGIDERVSVICAGSRPDATTPESSSGGSTDGPSSSRACPSRSRMRRCSRRCATSTTSTSPPAPMRRRPSSPSDSSTRPARPPVSTPPTTPSRSGSRSSTT
jgi:dienelactone hydrolase